MQIEKRIPGQIRRNTLHQRHRSRVQPSLLLSGQDDGVRQPGEHPVAGDQTRRILHLDHSAVLANGQGDIVQRHLRLPLEPQSQRDHRRDSRDRTHPSHQLAPPQPATNKEHPMSIRTSVPDSLTTQRHRCAQQSMTRTSSTFSPRDGAPRRAGKRDIGGGRGEAQAPRRRSPRSPAALSGGTDVAVWN